MAGHLAGPAGAVEGGVQALYGERLVKMVLYGSRARGDARWDSDVDVLVVLEGMTSHSAEVFRSGEIVARDGVAI